MKSEREMRRPDEREREGGNEMSGIEERGSDKTIIFSLCSDEISTNYEEAPKLNKSPQNALTL